MRSKENRAADLMMLQDSITGFLCKLDPSLKLKEDLWQREEGGGGRTRILADGDIVEKGGVNFSAVHGPAPAFMKADRFFASGVSLVLHPRNPMVPIIHMNVRYLETSLDGKVEHWFGGGMDVTPHYVFPEDARWFHQQLKAVCDPFGPTLYSDYKKWADDYFFITHRNETRGVGGLFFDFLKGTDTFPLERVDDFIFALGNQFNPIYEHLTRNHGISFTEQNKTWQLQRRGRYAEFNLVYDRGTKFGLETAGRIESILMSLPPLARWDYNVIPAQGSAEETTLNWLKKDIDWLSAK